jgi:putative acetyltransferase
MIRRVLDSDFPRLAEIYTEAVRRTPNRIYTPEQIDAWSAFPAKTEKFRQFVFGPETYAVIVENMPVAFCGLGHDGHIASLYVHPDYNRMGYASQLLQYIMERGERGGMRRFHTEASFLSKAVFERHGFIVDRMDEVDYDGVLFRRFKMVRLVEAHRH